MSFPLMLQQIINMSKLFESSTLMFTKHMVIYHSIHIYSFWGYWGSHYRIHPSFTTIYYKTPQEPHCHVCTDDSDKHKFVNIKVLLFNSFGTFIICSNSNNKRGIHGLLIYISNKKGCVTFPCTLRITDFLQKDMFHTEI